MTFGCEKGRTGLRSMMAGSVSLAALLLAAPAMAASIPTPGITLSPGDISTISESGVAPVILYGSASAGQTLGQTFTVGTTETVLDSVSFLFVPPDSSTVLNYKAYLYSWNGLNGVGSPLFESQTQTATEDEYLVTLQTGGLQLQAGGQYVIFFTTATLPAQEGAFAYSYAFDQSYAGGALIGSNFGASFADVVAMTDASLVSNYDLYFVADFSAFVPVAGAVNAPGLFRPTTRMMNDFLAMSLNPFTASRGAFGARFAAAPSIAPLGFADDKGVLSADEQDAFEAVATHGDAGAELRHWNVWGSTYGGYAALDGKAGSAGSQSRGYGMAAGLDYWLSADTMFGAALGLGQAGWEMGEGNGSGNGDIYQLGLYARHDFGGTYLGASLSAAWQSMETVRTSGASTLRADYDATNFGGRIEAGHAVATALATFTPYGAFQLQQLNTPNYTETGNASLAMSFDDKAAISSRGELGVMVEKAVSLSGGKDLTLFGKLAWAHDFKTDASLSGVNSGGTSFLVQADAGPANQALISAGAELQLDNGWSASASFDGEFASRSQSYAANGRVAYSW
ncbi:autotransporter domain-containing protein [Roseibium aestuarii]|uniref:Autotransporter domain-containing protein n=1 Tax=Roseibium aestuarii TaxID=2600299 RepID=A0ABW4JTM2_9HYPH|nr:autotransporter domain-containing protein [Roseibium aestuarii]